MKQVLFCLLSIVLLKGTGVAAEQASRPPNIVLIVADDLGYECLADYGSNSYDTPQLDKLAATGMRFAHCFSQPTCSPSRCQLMTGIYNVRNYQADHLLDPDAITFANVLRSNGYATCIAGKWQLSGGWNAPKKFGFDEYCLWQLVRRPERYRNPGLEINGKEVDFTHNEYGPDICNRYLCDFIKRHKDQPFLAYYPMILPHSPHVPTPASKDYGTDKSGQEYFRGMVEYVDKLVGNVVQTLDEAGLREHTLILFTGDNGTVRGMVSMVGNLKVTGDKGFSDDGGTHVPLIANWPGSIPAGKVCTSLVDFTDFMPTVCDAAGTVIPRELNIDGQSFLPQLRGEKGNPRKWIYSWYNNHAGATPKAEYARDEHFRLDRNGTFYKISKDGLKVRTIDRSTMDGREYSAREKLQAALDKYKGARPAKVADWALTHEVPKGVD